MVSGWGLQGDDHSASSPVLREVKSTIISNLACRMAYMGQIQRHHICLSGEERRSTCRGDSGGPLVVDGEQVRDHTVKSFFICFLKTNNKYILAGGLGRATSEDNFK